MKNILKDLSYLLIILYLCIFFISELYTMDRIAPQYFLLSILNLIVLFLAVINDKIFKVKIFEKQTLSLKLAICFLIISLSMILSFFFSENLVESLVSFSQLFTNFISFFGLLILMYSIRQKNYLFNFFYFTILFLLLIESSYVFYQILNEYFTKNLLGNFGRTFAIRGFTGNINITAFSLVYKIPFIFFLSKNIKTKFFFKLIEYFIIFVSVFDLVHLSSRGALLSLYVIILFTSFILIYNKIYNKNYNKRVLYKLLFLITSLIVSNFFVLNDNTLNIVNRSKTISISTQDGSINQRLRYYSQIINYVFENSTPIGVGNYKIKSIEFDKDEIMQYIVPYHAHNDFLEILIENGIFAFLAYILIFVFFSIHLISNFIKTQDYLFLGILTFLIIYFIDSSLNFPITRPISFIFFNFILSFTCLIDSKIK